MPYHSFLRILLLTIRTDYTIALFTAIVLSIFTAGALNDGNRYTRESVLNSGSWVRVKVYDNGIYQISYSDLQQWGFSDPSKVKVYGYGGKMLEEDFTTPYTDDLPEIPVYHAGDVLCSVFTADGAAEPDREKRTGALTQLPFTNWRPSWSIS